uniref:Uncharacterized protein n=1 Tax=Cannabis sativa TaxID=3483 RepID=A0A803PSD2_CANSA
MEQTAPTGAYEESQGLCLLRPVDLGVERCGHYGETARKSKLILSINRNQPFGSSVSMYEGRREDLRDEILNPRPRKKYRGISAGRPGRKYSKGPVTTGELFPAMKSVESR